MIYLQKDEEVFVKYGDVEAEIYLEAEKMAEAMRTEEEK